MINTHMPSPRAVEIGMEFGLTKMMDKLNWAYGKGKNINHEALFEQICNSLKLYKIRFKIDITLPSII